MPNSTAIILPCFNRPSPSINMEQPFVQVLLMLAAAIFTSKHSVLNLCPSTTFQLSLILARRNQQSFLKIATKATIKTTIGSRNHVPSLGEKVSEIPSCREEMVWFRILLVRRRVNVESRGGDSIDKLANIKIDHPWYKSADRTKNEFERDKCQLQSKRLALLVRQLSKHSFSVWLTAFLRG